MGMSDQMIFDGVPVAKPRMTVGDRANYRPVTKRYWAFKKNLIVQAKQQGFELGPRHKITFYMKIPKSYSKKKLDGKPHQKRPDLDNLCKAVWDSLLREDSTCHYLVVSKKYSTEPRIVIENFPENLEF